MKEILQQIDLLQEQINKHRPLNHSELQQIKEYYRIGLTYTSNALEGNSLTETETKIVLEEGITIGGKPLVDHLEAVGHSQSYDFLFERSQQKVISQDDINQLHKLFYYKINPQEAGVYRTVNAYITGSKFPLPHPGQLELLMQKLIVELDELRPRLHPVEFAALAHKKFVFIHPFVDGNGRVARLLMNLILLQSGYTITLIPPVTRATYIQSLEKAHTNDADFTKFIANMVKETQQDYLRLFCN